MPHFKTQKFSIHIPDIGHVGEKVSIKINADGDFYCYLPDKYIFAVKDVFKRDWQWKEDKIRIHSTTFAGLESSISAVIRINAQPEILEEPIIRYNIESHVSFAEDDAGNIFPNAGYPGAKWKHHSIEGMYGDHCSSKLAKGGYGLIVGAKAVMKKTLTYGETKKIKYEGYYKGGHHLTYENPAQLLNSWASIKLPDDAKEIPYTDEAALFFHNLMLGMSQLSKRIQEATFDQQNLLKLISEGSGLLLPERTK